MADRHMSSSTHRFSSSLPMMLYRALDVVMPKFRQIYREFGITEQQWRVLRVLWEFEQLPFRTLADITLIPAPSLVGVVDRLQSRGLVERRPDENDRRGVFVKATETGRDLKVEVMPLVDAAYLEIRNSVDSDTWEQLLNGLDCVCALDAEPDAERLVANK